MTKGKLQIYKGERHNSWSILDSEESVVARQMEKEEAERLVACWNACEGLGTQHLEDFIGLGFIEQAVMVSGYIKDLKTRLAATEKIKEELLEVLKEIMEEVSLSYSCACRVWQNEENYTCIVCKSRKAIENAENAEKVEKSERSKK